VVNASQLDCGSNTMDSCVSKIHVFKIVTKPRVYIIYAFSEKDSSQFAIISLKQKGGTGEKIKQGKSYALKLNPYFSRETFPDHMLIFEVIVSGMKIKVPSEGWASNVYTTPDLSGLKIIHVRYP
jgi:hypothetical protein